MLREKKKKKEKKSKAEAVYLGLKDCKTKIKKKKILNKSNSLHKEPVGCVSPSRSRFRIFRPLKPNEKQRGLKEISNPGKDVDCLGQTRVSLREKFISDHRNGVRISTH